MTCRLESFRRIAALSAAITMLTSSLAMAQTPAAPPASPTTQPRLLGTHTFQGLFRQPWITADRLPVVASSPQDGLLPQAIAATTRKVLASPAPKSGTTRLVVPRKSIAGVLLVVGVVVAALALCALANATTCDFGD